jgi:hypothetical protein
MKKEKKAKVIYLKDKLKEREQKKRKASIKRLCDYADKLDW